MWSEKCDSDCLLQKLFEMIRSRDHARSSHRQFFFDSLISLFDEWRMLILDYRVTYVCSRFVERRLWWNVKLDKASHQTWNDSSNLTRTTHQTWREKASFHQTWRKRHFINLTKTSSYQIWRESHLIKLLKRKTISLLSDEQFCSDTWCEELSLAENHFLYEDCCDKWALLMKAERWYNSTFSYKERASSYVKTMSDCRRSDSSSS